MQFKINLGKRLTIKKVIMQVVVVGKPDNDKIDGKDEFLYRIQEQILKYAKENDGINSIKVHLSKDDLHKLRHQYLHRSNQDDDIVAMYGRYKEGKPKRDILQG